jgi:predicted MFS family arabinose efflux permease
LQSPIGTFPIRFIQHPESRIDNRLNSLIFLTTSSPLLAPKNERLFLLTVAGIQFTHILDFMIMMPLGPQLIRILHIDTHQFGLLLSSYTLTAAASSLLAATYIDRFDRRKLMLTLYLLFILATLSCGLAPNYESRVRRLAHSAAFSVR